MNNICNCREDKQNSSSVIHTFETDSTVFLWIRCSLCGGVYLEKKIEKDEKIKELYLV